MNDNDIVKALECCTGIRHKQACAECPACVGCNDCVDILREESLDIINRQKAEIERYEKEHNENFNKWQLLDDRTKQRYAELYEEAKAVVRAEAVKEFAERLKKKAVMKKGHFKIYYLVDISDIDNLVKEMEA